VGGGAWQVGTLAPGAAASLQVTVAATAAGSHTLAAEVSASGIFDPSSTPGNGGVEDDRGVSTVAVPATGGSGGRQSLRLAPRSLGISVVRKPKKGRVKTLAVSGRLVLPRVRPAPRCSGKVRVRALAGKRVLASRTVPLKARKGVCGYSALLTPTKLRSASTISVSAGFLGSAQLKPRNARAVKVKVLRR